MRKFGFAHEPEIPFHQLSVGMLYYARAVVTGVAAQFSALQIQNPVGSAKYIVIQKVRGYLATAGRVQFEERDTLLTTVITPRPMRRDTGVTASALCRSAAAVAVGTIRAESDALLTMSDLTPFSPLHWLGEGQGYAVLAETANITGTFEVYWSEFWQ